MSDYTLSVPEEIYLRARRIAEKTAQPVDNVLIEHLKQLSEPIPALPPDEQAELDALKLLSDDAVWTIAREQMPLDIQHRMRDLMDKNTFGTISDAEFAELEQYVERGNRLMLRKAEAAVILLARGYQFTQEDFKAKDE